MDLFDNLCVHTGQPAADWQAASFAGNDLLLQALCASPIAADQSPSCPSSNLSSKSKFFTDGHGASMLNMEHQLQQQLEPGRGSFAPFAGYQAAAQQLMPPFSNFEFAAAPGTSPCTNVGAVSTMPQHQQRHYFDNAVMQRQAAPASSAQPSALAVPCNSSNSEAAHSSLTRYPDEQQHLVQLLLHPQHQQHLMPQACNVQSQSFLQTYPQQQQQHQLSPTPLVPPQELQHVLQPKQEPNCYAYRPQLQMTTPPRYQQVTTAQQVLAAADAAAAARNASNRQQPAKQAGRKRPAAKQLQQPSPAARARVPASSEDDAACEAAAPKKRGRPPLTPGKYSRGYLAIKAYRQRKKGMVEVMEAEVAALQEQVALLQAEQAALQLKHQALQAATAASDEVLSQMAALQLNPPAAATNTATSNGLGVSSDVAAAVLDSALAAVQAGSSSSSSSSHAGDADWASVLALVKYELQRTASLAQQQAQQRSNAGAIAAVGRYKAFVLGTAEHHAQGLLPPHGQQQRSPSPVSPAANSSSSGFPTFPLGIADLLQLAQLQRSLQEPAAAADDSSSACMLNLGTGASVEVRCGFWATVAQHVPPPSHQQQQRLEALWEVYHAALGRLAQGRQQLLSQLSAGPAGSDPAGPVGIEGSLKLAAALEHYASRARAMTLSFEWALQGLLTDEQAAKMCMACWPYLPAVGAVVSSMLGRQDAV